MCLGATSTILLFDKIASLNLNKFFFFSVSFSLVNFWFSCVCLFLTLSLSLSLLLYRFIMISFVSKQIHCLPPACWKMPIRTRSSSVSRYQSQDGADVPNWFRQTNDSDRTEPQKKTASSSVVRNLQSSPFFFFSLMSLIITIIIFSTSFFISFSSSFFLLLYFSWNFCRILLSLSRPFLSLCRHVYSLISSYLVPFSQGHHMTQSSGKKEVYYLFCNR